jgi:hypothetical protein
MKKKQTIQAIHGAVQYYEKITKNEQARTMGSHSGTIRPTLLDQKL